MRVGLILFTLSEILPTACTSERESRRYPVKFEARDPLQDAKAALEIQEQILQKSKGDEPWMKEVVTGLAKSAKDFQDSADTTRELVKNPKAWGPGSLKFLDHS